LGTFGAAFAVDVARIWEEALKIKANIAVIEAPIRKLILSKIGDKRFTKIEEYNFTVGMPSSPLRDSKYMTFIDAGFSFGFPYPFVSEERPERFSDIMIFFDMSEGMGILKSDPEKAAGELRKAADYAKKNNLKFPVIDRVIPKAIN